MFYETGTRERELEQELRRAKAKLKEQDEVLQALGEQAKPIVQVVEVGEKKLTIANGPNLMEVHRPKGRDIRPGDLATFLAQSGQLHDVFRPDLPVGIILTVKNVLDGRVEIESPQGSIVLRCALPVKPSDRVIVDRALNVVLDVVGPAETTRKFTLQKRVLWDEIGGNESAKKALREAIEVPYRHADVFAAYGKRPVKGVLLYGPPGCGKTLLAQAAATSLADIHGASGEAGFIYVKGPELLSKWVGESETSIRELFSSAREHRRRHGHPALLFIDEADAILGKRTGDSRGGALSSTLIPQFLSEMDGLEDSGAMVLLATNRPEALDAAVVRDGRVDRRVKVERPGIGDVETIASLYLRGKPTKLAEKTLAEIMALELFRDDRVVKAHGPLTLLVRDFVSGAMVAGAVDQASTRAMMRDIENPRKKPSGLTIDDISWAVDQIQSGMTNIDHTEVIMSKLEAA